MFLAAQLFLEDAAPCAAVAAAAGAAPKERRNFFFSFIATCHAAPGFFLLSKLAPKLVDLESRLSHVELGVYRICLFFFGSSSGHVA